MEHHYNAWQDQQDQYEREECARAKRFWRYFQRIRNSNSAIRLRKFRCNKILAACDNENDIPF